MDYMLSRDFLVNLFIWIRLRRKTTCFSKPIAMHDIVVGLAINRDPISQNDGYRQ